MTKPPSSDAAPVNEFVREAIREKAARELAALDQRTAAFDAAVNTRSTLDALSASLAGATPALVACADSQTISRLKKLRKAVDDATLLADEIASALGVDVHRAELDAQRAEIERALASVGIGVDRLPLAAE
ncbi:MAG: hypothetical protein NVS3B20_24500 [Polyangiales bacterium]